MRPFLVPISSRTRNRDSSHVTGAHRYAEPVSSHKNMFCPLRPPRRARKGALRLDQHPPTPRNLAGGRVGPRPAAVVHILARSRPSVVHAKRVASLASLSRFTAPGLRGGFAPTAQPRRAAALFLRHFPAPRSFRMIQAPIFRSQLNLDFRVGS